MTNMGIYPPDPATPVGSLRLLVGDTDAIDLDPPIDGVGDYGVWSDAALEVALAAQDGNQLRAAGTLYLQLAAEAALGGRSVKTDDLAIDTTRRGTDIRAIAQSFFDEATAADNAETVDFFQIVPFAGRRGREAAVRPEGTPRPLI